MTRIIYRWLLPALLLALVLAPVPALAHYPWLLPEQFRLPVAQPLELSVGWGHTFPRNGYLPAEQLEYFYLLDPAGQRLEVQPATGGQEPLFTTAALATPGTYLVAAQRRGGYYTRTTEGGRSQSKKELANAISCSYTVNTMKAVVQAGAELTAPDRVLGQDLELIPGHNPSALQPGDKLPFQLLRDGQPLSAEFRATYAGYSATGDGYAHQGETDEQGNAGLPLSAPGPWIIVAEQRTPYPARATCDHLVHRTIFTFQVEEP